MRTNPRGDIYIKRFILHTVSVFNKIKSCICTDTRNLTQIKNLSLIKFLPKNKFRK